MTCDCENCFQMSGPCEFAPDGALDDGQDEFERAPDFGCACENPLVVDTVCESCIEWLKEQEAQPDAQRPAL